MKNEFKKAGYFTTIIIFILGVLALVISTVANYFSYDESVVAISEMVALFALLGLLISNITAKGNYNKICVKFAEYILGRRQQDAERNSEKSERLKEIQNMKSAAAQERENAVAAALEQGRNEGAQAAAAHMARQQAIRPQAYHQSHIAQTPAAQPQVLQPQIVQQTGDNYRAVYPSYLQNIAPNEEVLYNEYGEPVMIRRRVRKSRAQDGSILYDRYGTPVLRQAEYIPEIPVNEMNFVPSNAAEQPVAHENDIPQSQTYTTAEAPKPATAAPSANESASAVSNPLSIPKLVDKPLPPPPVCKPKNPVPTVASTYSESHSETSHEPEKKPVVPDTISTTNHQGASSAVSREQAQSTGQPYKVSWPSNQISDEEIEDAAESRSPINLNI